ncbi:FAD-dependent oxidoreductase [Sedimentisphaera salicampi]|uniref:FAD-dependent oxidoreductase n=1 Tax=Sedimentisphaera salicampi TaxID=1941349 RepID=UPI000B9D37BA|nr:FAD-dependent oxidoreductase [Sedimentisphaera salicampi]OXU15661.1 anaerobic glycerol-3-phosphate dehydrogenase subunit B [Sedimentisphaera salicampi]
MKRRDFIKGSLAISVIAGQDFSWAGSENAPSILLEAAQFQTKGGWVLDQQFMDQMGSAFLLAHGLGNPVADAVATVKFPETGTYKLWVRTRDWVAPWKTPDIPKTKRAEGTPGIFKVLIDGEEVKTTFGNCNSEWHWQEGGTVEIKNKEAEISLHDLTGFEGRCAGVFLTKDISMTPPDGGEELQRFRRKWHGYSERPEEAGWFDLVVVGGGMAGLGAAVSAAREGLKVALIQDRPVVAGNNSSEVRVWLHGSKSSEYSDILGSVLKEFEQKQRQHQGGKNTGNIYEDENKLAVLKREKTLSVFLSYRMNRVETDGRKITAIIAEHIETGRRLSFKGQTFADCTGDGCVGYSAGADYEMTVNDKDGHMGRSNLWYTIEHSAEQEFPRCPWALQLDEKPFPGRKDYPSNSYKSRRGLKGLGVWYWESGFNHDPFEKSEYIRDWNFRAMYGAWDTLKNVDKLHKNRALGWAAYISGKRESRRLMGDIILTKKDVIDYKWYDDVLVPTGWKIDVHVPDKAYDKGLEGDAFISKALFTDYSIPYYLPYRCLYSRTIDNLFMAGRNISVTHEALGTVRVMRTCCLMGEVVGRAASLCRKYNAAPREVYHRHLKELLELNGYAKEIKHLKEN